MICLLFVNNEVKVDMKCIGCLMGYAYKALITIHPAHNPKNTTTHKNRTPFPLCTKLKYLIIQLDTFPLKKILLWNIFLKQWPTGEAYHESSSSNLFVERAGMFA